MTVNEKRMTQDGTSKTRLGSSTGNNPVTSRKRMAMEKFFEIRRAKRERSTAHRVSTTIQKERVKP